LKVSKVFLILTAVFLGARLWAGEPFESNSQPNPSDANTQNTMNDTRPQAQMPSPGAQDAGNSVVQGLGDVQAATGQTMPQTRSVGEQSGSQTSFLSFGQISRGGN